MWSARRDPAVSDTSTWNIAPHPAIAVVTVLHTEVMTYAAGVTAQATDAADPIYQRDADTILTGCQLLPPSPE